MKRKEQIFLILAIVSLTIAGSFLYLFTNTTNTDFFIKKVQSNLEVQSDNADNFLFEFKRKLKEDSDINFGNLLTNSQYPVFVFHQKKLVYWSDYRFAFPEYEDLPINPRYYKEKCIEVGNSIYWLKKSSLVINNQDYEIILAIPLSWKYPNENDYLQSHLNEIIFPENACNIVIAEGLGHDFKSKYGEYLFTINFDEEVIFYQDKQFVVLFFFLLAIGFTLYFIHLIVQKLIGHRHPHIAFLFIVSCFIILRVLMILFEFPYQIINSEIFYPNQLSNFLGKSLGDLFINLFVTTLVIIFFSSHFIEISYYKRLLNSSLLVKRIVSIAAVFFTYFTIHLIFYILQSIFIDAGVSFGYQQQHLLFVETASCIGFFFTYGCHLLLRFAYLV